MAAASVHAEPPPRVVHDPEGLQYETGPQLGKGGFAICHRANLLGHEHMRSNTVALKIVKSKMEPPKLAQKFVTELQIHSKLAHPNIVEFYRAFSFDSSTFVVLELCENGSLADAIKKRKYFTMPEIRRFMIQTCGAIKYLHQRNIVHRDLKTGNLFLDKDMNVKVGDFGLAALLVSQTDQAAIRRTTMCGTPNYLAPEVLEKTGKGHDEKVDLWAIGIMMYTLAVGRAPFHAAKREDIYRKLKAREYSWPDLAKCPNEITDDLRDIVSLLLVHEDDRPTPDQIVNHSFFKLGHIPLTLDSICTSRVPKWPKIRPPTAAAIRKGYTDEWYTLCKSSSVGEYEPGKSFGAYGSRRNKTVARDCQKEIESGKQPSIPFAKDTVYLPFPERTHWPFQAGGGLSEIPEEKETSSEGQALVETTGNDRVQGRPPRTARREPLPTLKENAAPTMEEEPANPRIEKQPIRMRAVRKISNPGRVTAATATAAPIRAPRDSRTVQRTKSARETVRGVEASPVELEFEEAARESRALQRTKSARETVRRAEPPPVEEDAPTPNKANEVKKRVAALRVVSHEIPYSDPASILPQLSSFRDNIQRALLKKRSRSTVPENRQLPLIVRWVDYSRKHGIGFVLDDGNVGCLAAVNRKHRVTSAVINHGLVHLTKAAEDNAYAKKIPLAFYATTDDSKGLSRVEITDKQREDQLRACWLKFGNYMFGKLGNSDQVPEKGSRRHSFVKFYQRLGNVGIWVFDDGSLQINFPDHTKLSLSADASYCNFMCLPIKGAQELQNQGTVAWRYVMGREKLHGSLQQLLYGSVDKDDAYKKITEANVLRTKLEYLQAVIDGWIEGGGLGCLSNPTDYVWEGPAVDDNKKADWITVGRLGGD